MMERDEWNLIDLMAITAAMEVCNRLANSGAVSPDVTSRAVLALGDVLGIASKTTPANDRAAAKDEAVA